MFFTLCVEEGEGGLKEKFLDYFRSPNIKIEKVSLKAGSAFYKLTCSKYHGDIPWKEIEQACGKLCKRAVLPQGVVPPPETAVCSYVPTILPFRILFNSAVEVLRKLDLNPNKMSITVFDENAAVLDLVEKLKDISFLIRIITLKVDEYKKLAARLFSRYGLSLIIRTKGDDSVLSSTVIISNKSDCVPFTFRGILFTNERRRMFGCALLSGEKITLAPPLCSVAPKNVNMINFAAALYELCGIRELDKLQYDDIC